MAPCDIAIDTIRKSLQLIAIMQQIIPITQLFSRASVIGLKQHVLAELSGLPKSTVSRAKDRGSCNSKTLEKLSAVVLAEEDRLRKVLPQAIGEVA
jgi:hypothetical protein